MTSAGQRIDSKNGYRRNSKSNQNSTQHGSAEVLEVTPVQPVGYWNYSHDPGEGRSFQQLMLQLGKLQKALAEAHEQELAEALGGVRSDTDAGRMTFSQSSPPQRGASEDSSDLPGAPEMLANIPKPPSDDSPIVSSRRVMAERIARVAKIAQTMEVWKTSLQAADHFSIFPVYDIPDERLLEMSQRKKRMVDTKSRLALQTWRDDDQAESRPCCIVHPSSKGRLMWDLMAMIVLMYDLVMVPMQVFDMPESSALEALAIVVSIYWTFDISANLVTAIYVSGRLVTKHTTIWKHYAKTWLAFDIFVVTTDWIALTESASSATDSRESVSMARGIRSGRVLRMLRFIRLLRIMKLKRILDDLRSHLNSATLLFFVSIAQLFFFTMFLTHMLACLWYAIGDVQDGWVVENGLSGQPLGLTYLKSFQWSLSRLHPSTMRDNMNLKTDPERMFALLASFGALLFSALFISNTTNTMAKFSRLRKEKSQKLTAIGEYCALHGIGTDLAVKLKKYIEREEERKRQAQAHETLGTILPSAMLRVLYHTSRSPILCEHTFFMGLRQDHPGTEIDICLHALKEMSYLAGDEIFETGYLSTRMYMVTIGQLIYRLEESRRATQRRSSVSSGDSQEDRSLMGQLRRLVRPKTQQSKRAELGNGWVELERGECLSEAALWVAIWHTTGGLRALTHCQLIAVSTEDLGKCLQQDEVALAEVIIYARKFVEDLNAMENVTDLAPEQFPGMEKEESLVPNSSRSFAND